ncbi:MAG TPA: pepsin/retropepsin-like aspartic protease family protein [Rhizomicrobium sp.]|nr:pepsin/retropepsin-like aspartic protease family protein [Rhizomicrobium sp.]
MTTYRKCALAAAALALSLSAARADTPACSLGLMASLDMTALPDARAAVPVTLNGTTYQFMVDTAGVFSKISKDAVKQLGLSETPTSMELYGVKGKQRISAVDVASLKIGNNEAKHFHVAVEGGEMFKDRKFDGVFAADLLTLFDVEFDFGAEKMNLFSQDHCPGKVVYWTRSGYAELPFRLTSGPFGSGNHHIVLSMTLDGHDLSTDLDTGSTFTWMSTRDAATLFSIDDKSAGVERIPGVPADYPGVQKRFGLLQIGGVAVQNPMIEIVPDRSDEAFRMEHSEKSRDDPIYGSQLEHEQLTLGMNVLTKLHLFIAYKEHKVYATAADAH